MKKMQVVLEIEVDDLSDATRKELADDMGMDASEIETLADISAPQAAEPLNNICEETCTELFAGSDTYVTYKDVRVKSAAFIE